VRSVDETHRKDSGKAAIRGECKNSLKIEGHNIGAASGVEGQLAQKGRASGEVDWSGRRWTVSKRDSAPAGTKRVIPTKDWRANAAESCRRMRSRIIKS
jgi:hypothetical protein